MWSPCLSKTKVLKRSLEEYLFVQLYFKLLDEIGSDIIEVVRDVGHGAMKIEGFAILPFFNEGHPASIIGTLVELVAEAAWFLARWPNQGVKRLDQIAYLAFMRPEFCHTNYLN